MFTTLEGIDERDEEHLHIELFPEDSDRTIQVVQFKLIILTSPNQYPLKISKYVQPLTRETLKLINISNDQPKQFFAFNLLSNPLYAQIYVLSFWLIFCLKSDKVENQFWVNHIRYMLNITYQNMLFKITLNFGINPIKNEIIDMMIHVIAYGIHKLFNILFLMSIFTRPAFGEWVHYQLNNEFKRNKSNKSQIKFKILEYFGHNFMSYLKENEGIIELTGNKITFKHQIKEINDKIRNDYNIKLKENLDIIYSKKRGSSPFEDTSTKIFKQFEPIIDESKEKIERESYASFVSISSEKDNKEERSAQPKKKQNPLAPPKLILNIDRIGKLVKYIKKSSNKTSDPPVNTNKVLSSLKIERSLPESIFKSINIQKRNIEGINPLLTERGGHSKFDEEMSNLLKERMTMKNSSVRKINISGILKEKVGRSRNKSGLGRYAEAANKIIAEGESPKNKLGRNMSMYIKRRKLPELNIAPSTTSVKKIIQSHLGSLSSLIEKPRSKSVEAYKYLKNQRSPSLYQAKNMTQKLSSQMLLDDHNQLDNTTDLDISELNNKINYKQLQLLKLNDVQKPYNHFNNILAAKGKRNKIMDAAKMKLIQETLTKHRLNTIRMKYNAGLRANSHKQREFNIKTKLFLLDAGIK